MSKPRRDSIEGAESLSRNGPLSHVEGVPGLGLNVRLVSFFLAALLSLASLWFYFDLVLVPHQVADASAHERPRGNLSDLYPRWLGARELLLHRRNPYSPDITREIQQGYYGRVLDGTRPNDPKDQQGFAYPVYVVFLLAPLVSSPFHQVQLFFHWFLIAATVASVWAWMRVMRWRLPLLAVAAAAALMLGSVPAVQGIKLQQLSLLVAALVSVSVACASQGLLLTAGGFLALAAIKPQLVAPLGAWFLLWTMAKWRARWKLLFGCGSVMAILLVGAEFVLPGWLRMFAAAVRQYHDYTNNQSVLDQLVPWGPAGNMLAAAAVIAALYFLWRFRFTSFESRDFVRTAAMVMALTVLVVPMYAPYNQVMLLPVVFLLLQDRSILLSRSQSVRFLYAAACLAVCWQWIASIFLAILYVVSPGSAMNGWKAPFFATFAIPVLIFALTVVDLRAMCEGAAHKEQTH